MFTRENFHHTSRRIGKEWNFISSRIPFKTQSDGIKPNAIIPLPSTADKDKSEVFATALTEFKNSSGAADPNATKVTAV